MSRMSVFKIHFSVEGTLDDDSSGIADSILRKWPHAAGWGYVRKGKIGVLRVYGVEGIPCLGDFQNEPTVVAVEPSSEAEFNEMS